jgi:hypothetical protein
LCQIIANLAQYRFDEWDSSAVANGINGTDNEKGLRFEYPLEGTDLIRLSIARETGTATVHVQVTFPDHLIGRVETALDIASEYGLSTNRWGNACDEDA